MGCGKKNNIVFSGKAKQIKKTLGIFLVTTMLIAAITPLVYAAHSDTIVVTFDPSGDIDLEVWPATANFTAVTFDTGVNWPTEGGTDTSYTLYNNGSQAADIYIFSNTTTDSADMSLEDVPGNIGTDEYCLNVTGSDAQQITGSNVSWSGVLNGGEATRTFGINLLLGDGTADFGWQTTTINITGTLN